ncbi:hypothetical protein BC826DRAFT_1063662, partial [Russula brevipes]
SPDLSVWKKWFYTFVLTSQARTKTAPRRAANATSNPFTDTPVNPPPGYRCKRWDGMDHAHPPQDYRRKICNNRGHFLRDFPTKYAIGDAGGRKPREVSELHSIEGCPVVKGRRPDDCWFCLSNPALAKYLIVAYFTFPKGKLVPTNNAGRYGSEDVMPVLIVPILHSVALDAIPGELRTSIVNECNRYQAALRALYAKNSCCYLRGRAYVIQRSHAHIQAVPVPLRLESRLKSAGHRI